MKLNNLHIIYLPHLTNAIYLFRLKTKHLKVLPTLTFLMSLSDAALQAISRAEKTLTTLLLCHRIFEFSSGYISHHSRADDQLMTSVLGSGVSFPFSVRSPRDLNFGIFPTPRTWNTLRDYPPENLSLPRRFQNSH